MMDNNKYRSYTQQMEKALKAFEYTTEWADLVNALGKVNKVLANYSQFPVIPRPATIGQRLAQCMHPGLPNGVQLKALETYDLLFKAIGTDRLMQELCIYSNGLFPLLGHADLNVKPALLDLYESHFLPLNERLRPALDGFLIATLHGLEENTDFYKRTDDLLLRVCSGVGSDYFYGSLWRCILNDPSVRLHGMNFLISHFNKKRPLENQMHILGTSIETLINAICVSLLDTRNVLVQRAALDLLLCCFPLHNQQIRQNDMITIVTAAVTVLLRRDTSLNRRLHDWLFNKDCSASKKSTNLSIYGSSSNQSNTKTSREQREKERKSLYFETYAKQLVIEAYKNCLSMKIMIDIPSSWSSLGDFWCYRLLICQLDHNEICELIIDELSIEILRAMCIDFYNQSAPKPELIGIMQRLLERMDISYIWRRISILLNRVCKEKETRTQIEGQSDDKDNTHINEMSTKPVGAGPSNILELCAVSDFIMDSIPVQNYLKAAKLYLTLTLNDVLKLMNEQCDKFMVNEFLALLRIVRRLFQNIELHPNEDIYVQDSDYRYSTNTPINSNSMTLTNEKVVEDDEYAEDPGEQSSAESSNNSHVNNANSANETSCSNQVELGQIEDIATLIAPSICTLVENYQDLFHTIVIRRLVCAQPGLSEQVNLNTRIDQLYVVCSNYMLRKLPVTGLELKMPVIFVEKNLSPVYEKMCELLLDISSMPLTVDQSEKVEIDINGVTRPIETCVIDSTSSDAVTSSQNIQDTQRQTFNLDYCKPWVKDIIILSGFAEDAVSINYSSIKVLLNLLSVFKLALDSSFATANMLGQVTMPSFAAEINASVGIGDSLLYDQREDFRFNDFKQMLTEGEYTYISDKTCWFQMVMKKLWDNLRFGPKWNLYLDTVNLIQHLHNLTFQTSVCEDIICCNMNSPDEAIAYESRKRFEELMFSLPRDMKSFSMLKHRELERPLFFMLDSLSHKMDPFNCSAGHWLSRVFKSNLISRVLEPSLLILLHVDTARLPSSCTKIILKNQLHSHLLFYPQVYDSHRIVYALNTLWNIISAEPHRGLLSMAKSTIGTSYDLQVLYGRHRNSIAGKDFHADIVIEGQFRNVSLLEVIITICMDYLCGYYLNLSPAKLTQAEIVGNQRVRILACEILRGILSNFIEAIKSRPTFLPLIHDMLNRCRVQKIILHCIITSVYCAQQEHTTPILNDNIQSDNIDSDCCEVTSNELIDLNDGISNRSPKSNIFRDNFQKTLLRLLEEILKLEYRVAPISVITETECPNGRRESDSRSARIRYQPDITSSSLKYYQNILISSQSMFLTSIQTALQQVHQAGLHMNWLSMIEATLPIAGRSLTRLTVCVITQLCHNLEAISQMIIEGKDTQDIKLAMTPNYLSILIKSLSTLAHYCLIDSSSGGYGQQASIASNLTQRSESLSTLASTAAVGQASNIASLSQGCVSSASSVTLTSAGTNGPGSLGPLHAISNLWHVFSQDQGQDSMTSFSMNQGTTQGDPLINARKTILSRLSRIISALLQVWKAMVAIENHSDSVPWRVLGSPADVKKQILNFLSPISVIHGTHFMSAISVVWYDLRTISTLRSNGLAKRVVIPTCSADQSLLVQIIAAIRVLPMESVLQTTRQVMRSPPQAQDTRNKRRIPLEVGLLQFFLAYIKEYPVSQLLECWKSLLQLLREGVQLGPPAMPLAQFHLLAILHEFVQTAPLIEDRKDQKDLQDVTQKLIDSFTNVVGARLAQTRWLRSGLEVEPGPQNDALDEESALALFEKNFGTEVHDGIFSGESKLSEHFTDTDSIISTTTNNTNANADGDDSSYLAKFSVQALSALAEFVAPVLDVVYVSDEKEKVVSLINSIMYYVTPYLKNHHQHNSPSFLACSHLLSSISGYQYTRKAWRKDALELLLDSQFFQMDSSCMEHWKVIVDHLMTHDKTTFRDFLSRMSINQTGGALKLFASRDQEFEQRASLIKRMAFILFCSERDQYQKYIPEIQEKLIESLRVSQSDIVQAQIMLCFRVLVIRSSAHHLTSLWPFIYTEMFQVLLEIESQLESDSEKQEAANNGSSSRCQLFLYTCKLLDIVLALPADSLPQFQMYRWSFIGGCDDPPNDSSSSAPPYEPHLVRIERRLRARNLNPTLLPWRTHFPILTLNRISDPIELHPFFYTLVKMNEREEPCNSSSSASGADLAFIDSIIESDFLEPYVQ